MPTDSKLDYNSTRTSYTQTQEHDNRSPTRAALQLAATRPFSTTDAPPSELPTPWLTINLKLNRLHSCIDPARTCAAAAAVTQDYARHLALQQRRKPRVKQFQTLRAKSRCIRQGHKRHHAIARPRA